MPLEAADAERMAIVVCAQFSLLKAKSVVYVGDCKGALRLIDTPSLLRGSGQRHAGYVRELDANPAVVAGARWARSHRSEEEAVSASDLEDLRGSAEADRLARRGLDIGCDAAIEHQGRVDSFEEAVGLLPDRQVLGFVSRPIARGGLLRQLGAQPRRSVAEPPAAVRGTSGGGRP